MKSLFLLIVTIAATIAPTESEVERKITGIQRRLQVLDVDSRNLRRRLNEAEDNCITGPLFNLFKRQYVEGQLSNTELLAYKNRKLHNDITYASIAFTDANNRASRLEAILEADSFLPRPFTHLDNFWAQRDLRAKEANLNSLLQTDPEATVMSQAWSMIRNRLIPGAGTCLAGCGNVSITAIREYVVPGAKACFSGFLHGCETVGDVIDKLIAEKLKR